MIDETGRYIGEEYTLAICVAHVLRSAAGADRDQLLDQPDVGRFGERYGVPLVPQRGRRSECRRCDACCTRRCWGAKEAAA